jgi:hypothetical protein
MITAPPRSQGIYTSNCLSDKRPTPLVAGNSQSHSYVLVFSWTAEVFAAGAAIRGLLLRASQVPATGHRNQGDFTAAV